MGSESYKLLGKGAGGDELKKRLKHDGYSDTTMISDEMLNADARPSVLRMLNPSGTDGKFAFGMLKLKNVIRTSDFIFNTDFEDDLMEQSTKELYNNAPNSFTENGQRNLEGVESPYAPK